MHLVFTLFLLMLSICVSAQDRVTISGYVKEAGSEEQLPGVNVFIPDTPYGAVTNTYGFYSLTIPKSDSSTISFSFVGYERAEKRVRLDKDIQINIFLATINQLDEITVSARREEDYVSRSAQMSQIEVPISQIKKVPAFFGEKDVLKVLQLMPGVQKGTEGQTGLYVRGGGPDQNLIILDDAVVYNANHLFGFFSIFNSDALKSVELTKGGFPARFGGRLSSVLEMNMKEGAKDKLHGEGGIGLISSRLTLEGPISKKSSFLISGRRTYIDLLAKPLIAQQQRGDDSQVRPGYYFYDLNAKMNYDLGYKDKLYISGYFGRDKFYADEKSSSSETRAGLDWGNATATLRWNHLLNQKLFVNTSFIFSNFNFGVNSYSNEDGGNDEFSLRYNSRIRDLGIKTDFDYFPSPRHTVKFGAQATFHRFVPSALAVEGSFIGNPIETSVEAVNTVESGVYVEDTWQALDALKMNAGFRLSSFQTKTKNYILPEPRFSAALRLAREFSFKASYAQMNQYVHLLSNTGLGLPTDLWVPTTDKVKPQHSRQIAAGFAKDITKPALTLTLEGYYKVMDNIINYKEGSSFLSITGENANELSWEDNITAGRGWSYGTELLLQKKAGKLSGWIGYTLSWTKWQFPELNFGKIFYPRYDRRHDLSVVGIYELTKRITLSATWVYGTGNALTLPVARFTGVSDNFYTVANNGKVYTSWYDARVSEYGEKNSFRAEPFHRMDVAIQLRKKKRRHERTWEFGIYNVYNRRNPFFYDISEETKTNSNNSTTVTNTLKRYSLFPFLPSFSYNFKF